MIRLRIWLVWMTTLIVVVCSCAPGAQELSSYWEDHDFSSLDAFDDIDEAEEKFDGYIELLNRVPHKTAVKEMREFLDSAARNVVAYMVWSGWFEPYLHALESPYRNDELFVEWLDKVLEDKIIDDGSMMDHLKMMRVLVDRNKVGSKPEDITLRGEDEREFMLSELVGERMLMLFVDANCPSCLEALEENAAKYEGKDVKLVAILVNGSTYHIENIRKKLSEEVLAPWTLACCSGRMMEKDATYDITLLPFRMLVSKDGIIEKSYH